MIKKCITKLLLKLFYRVEVSGIENYQDNNDKILYVVNPTSLLDPILLSLFLPKKITLIIDEKLVDKWYIRPIAAFTDLIAVDFTSPNSTKKIIRALDTYSHCMVFHDKQFVSNPSLMKIYEATALIVSKTNAKLLPVLIDGAQYSVFSYFHHKTKLLMFPKISLNILPLQEVEDTGSVSAQEKRKFLASRLHSLMSELRYKAVDVDVSITEALVKAIKNNGKKKIIAEDQDRVCINYKTLFLKAQALGGALDKLFPDEKNVGLMLPNSLACVVAFFGFHFYKHTPAMINFSSSIDSAVIGCQTSLVKTVVTSKKFIKLAELNALENALKKANIRLIYLEDVANKISLSTKVKAVLKTLFLSVPKLNPNDPCAILFTSGSEGVPKAVLMSHRNVMANHMQIFSIITITSADRFFNCLPMFHTFGLTVGTLLPLLNGMRVFLYPSPLHYRIVPQLFYESLSTFLCGTDTFLTGYARYGKPYDFFNARYIIAGAEKLRATTIETYKNKFNIEVLEGYGATETSPVVSVNTPANKREHSVGKLLPGMEYKLLPVEGIDVGGNLCVRGDNIMLGYMKHTNPGYLEPPHEGWHELGDIVEVDKENFIYIKGRAKRFAKIGGEMVSLAAVEQALNSLLEDTIYGVVSIPDDKKGEVLVLLVEKNEITSGKISTHFASKGLPTLWVPKKIINLKSAPILGAGKFDYTKAKTIALEKVS